MKIAGTLPGCAEYVNCLKNFKQKLIEFDNCENCSPRGVTQVMTNRNLIAR